MSDILALSSLKLDIPSGKKAGEIVNYAGNLSGITFSVDDAVNKAGYGAFQVLITCLAGLGWHMEQWSSQVDLYAAIDGFVNKKSGRIKLADAFEIIILSVIGDFIACDWPLYRWQNALLTSMVFAGIMIGAPTLGIAADIYGRKKSLTASVSLLFLFGTVSAASPTFIWMAVFRCCMGFALGGVAQGLTLCCEYFPTNVRGKAGFYLCYFWSVGTIGVILMTWVIMEYLNNWRILIAAATIPVFLVIISLKWYPESARYYLVSNRHEEARKILERMAIMNGTQLPYGHLIEVSQCKRRGRFWDLLSKEYRKSTLLFWYIWLAVAFTYYGITLITPTIIQKGSLLASQDQNSTNFSYFDDLSQRVQCTQFTRQNYIDLLWSTAAEFPGLIIFTFLIEHCNRKVLLGASCAISGVLVFLLLLDTHKIVILLFLFGARAIILADFQLIFVMTTEAFPTSLRAIAMGSGSAFCRLGGMTIPYVAQVLVMENPIGAISLLGGSILLAAVATYYLPLETRGAEMKESHGVSNL